MVAWDRLTNRLQRTLVEAERRESALRKALLCRLTSSIAADTVTEIERRLLDYHPRAFLVADEGRELEIERALRRMHVYNPIPSRYGAWAGGRRSKSITIDHIIEDPAFKTSTRSYFIQLADCVAHALLKRETEPTERVKKYGVDEMFDEHIRGACYQNAACTDPDGIVRK